MSEMTTKDILAEMRDDRIIRIGDADVTRCLLRNLADRIEAALKREFGNVAKMREALNRLRNWALLDINENAIRPDETNYQKLVNGVVEITNAVLSEPARNCDVGNAVEQYKRFRKFCFDHMGDGMNEPRCSKCPLGGTKEGSCHFDWTQMPYDAEEGDKE